MCRGSSGGGARLQPRRSKRRRARCALRHLASRLAVLLLRLEPDQACVPDQELDCFRFARRPDRLIPLTSQGYGGRPKVKTCRATLSGSPCGEADRLSAKFLTSPANRLNESPGSLLFL